MKQMCMRVIGLVIGASTAGCGLLDWDYQAAGASGEGSASSEASASSGGGSSSGTSAITSGAGGVAGTGGQGGGQSSGDGGVGGDLCAGVVCAASDSCHAVGGCDPATGVCSSHLQLDGTACDDGDASTSNEVCTGGICLDPGVPVKMAMTWSLLDSATPNASNAYALVGCDALTDAYQGDTPINHLLPVLCINKNNPVNPGTGVIGSPQVTPGGASTHTWSSGTLALTGPVQGVKLTSLSVANDLCANQIGPGYRMAEFHDGDPALWSGWNFWGAALSASLGPFQKTRFWVSINGQGSNPW